MSLDVDVGKVREEPRLIHVSADGCVVEIFDGGAMQITRNGYVIRQHIWRWHQAARLGCEGVLGREDSEVIQTGNGHEG